MRRGGRISRRSRAVNQNVLPAPGVLRIPASPPISSDSLRVIASPRPVPPDRRVVERSACSNAVNSRGAASGAMRRSVRRNSPACACRSSPTRASGTISHSSVSAASSAERAYVIPPHSSTGAERGSRP